MRDELKVVLRSLARSRGYTLAVVGILALGLGCTAAIYSLVQEALFRARGLREPDRLVKIQLASKDQPQGLFVFLPHFLAYRDTPLTTLQGVAGCGVQPMNLAVGDQIIGLTAALATPDYLETLGVLPQLGRGFLPGEDQPGATPVALLTHRAWRRHFGSDPGILNREIRLNDRPFTVIGILPEDFASPFNYGEELYLPHPAADLVVSPTTATASLTMVVARLAPGATLELAQTELRALAPGQDLPVAKYFADFQPLVTRATARGTSAVETRYWAMNATALGASALLYLIAVVNAAGLMLVRTVGRQRELGVRFALGGSRWRVARPLLAEGLLLGATGTVLGLVVARWAFPALLYLAPSGNERWTAVSLSLPVLAALSALGLFTGLAIAAGAAWHVARLNLNETLKSSGHAGGENRRLQSARAALVVGEAALAVCLLVGAGLMVRSFQQLVAQKPGYDPARKLLLSISLPRTATADAKSRQLAFRQLTEALAAVPGVEAATFGPILVNSENSGSTVERFKIAGRPEEHQLTRRGHAVMPNFFDVLGVPTRLGRPLSSLRPGDPPGVIINESFAQQFFPNESPLGQQLEFSPKRKWEIVGVVGDIRSPREPATPRYYFPHWQTTSWLNQAQLRISAEPSADFFNTLSRAVYSVNPSYVVSSVMTAERRLENALGMERFVLANLQVLSALALLLAALGLFAMMAYTVAQRRLEFGIRLALGSTTAAIQRLVLRQGIGLAVLGVSLGLGLAWTLSRLLRSLLFQVQAHDPLTYAFVGGLMLTAALAACWWPARRSTRLDLSRLLRSD